MAKRIAIYPRPHDSVPFDRCYFEASGGGANLMMNKRQIV